MHRASDEVTVIAPRLAKRNVNVDAEVHRSVALEEMVRFRSIVIEKALPPL
jgi:hypothetical protein